MHYLHWQQLMGLRMSGLASSKWKKNVLSQDFVAKINNCTILPGQCWCQIFSCITYEIFSYEIHLSSVIICCPCPAETWQSRSDSFVVEVQDSKTDVITSKWVSVCTYCLLMWEEYYNSLYVSDIIFVDKHTPVQDRIIFLYHRYFYNLILRNVCPYIIS